MIKAGSRILGFPCDRWGWPFLLLCGMLTVIPVEASAQNIVRRNDEAGNHGKISLFQGLELNPIILPKLKHNIRIADWSQYEIDAYYEILQHLQNSSASNLKKKASLNRSANIELYRDQAQRIRDRDLKKNERQFEADAITEERFERNKRRIVRNLEDRLDQYEEFKKKPTSFRSFAMLFRSIDEGNPYEYHGKLVTLSGRIQRLISYPARQNKQGIERLYEAWIYTEDSQHNPTVVVMTTKPEGMPEGENIYEVGTVTGIFYKMHVYEDSGKKMRKAPMILAHGLEWRPASDKETSGWLYGILVGSVVLILGVAIWLNLQDRRMRKVHREIQNHRDNLSELSETEDPRSHLADLETQDRSNH